MKDTYLLKMLILIIVVLSVVNILLHINKIDNKFLLEQRTKAVEKHKKCMDKLKPFITNETELEQEYGG